MTTNIEQFIETIMQAMEWNNLKDTQPEDGQSGGEMED